MHDPAAYLTPDIALDVTGVDLSRERPGRGAPHRRARPPAAGHAEVLIGVDSGVLAEIEISYAASTARRGRGSRPTSSRSARRAIRCSATRPSSAT
jgi:hypothetical protein